MLHVTFPLSALSTWHNVSEPRACQSCASQLQRSRERKLLKAGGAGFGRSENTWRDKSRTETRQSKVCVCADCKDKESVKSFQGFSTDTHSSGKTGLYKTLCAQIWLLTVSCLASSYFIVSYVPCAVQTLSQSVIPAICLDLSIVRKHLVKEGMRHTRGRVPQGVFVALFSFQHLCYCRLGISGSPDSNVRVWRFNDCD